MTAPRRLTPPSIRGGTVPPRATPTPTAWDLAELPPPATPAIPLSLRPTANGFSSNDVMHLREQLQEQHVKALADARRAAFEEGRAAGRAEAQQSADLRVADAVTAVQHAAATVKAHEETYVGILEENLTALACAIARQVMQREVQLDPSAIRELVHQAVAEFPQEHALRVRLHPQDHALLHTDPAFREVSWIADPRIVRGGCVVEGRERIVDGRVDVALEQLFRALSGLDA